MPPPGAEPSSSASIFLESSRKLANLRELSKKMEAELLGSAPGGGIQDASGFWLNQINSDGQVIINAARSEQQGVRLTGLTLFRFDTTNEFKERIEAREATL